MKALFSTVLIFLFIAQTMMAANSKTDSTTQGREPAHMNSVLLPGRSPLVSFRILFMTGSASDPEGKEGVAALTAAMLSQGGSRTMTYEQILKALYPMAASFNAQVDKEMTVFSGTTHVDNLTHYYDIVKEMLLDPGFREDDFTRLRADAVNFLKVSLREANDEELGKERLYNVIYKGTPYEHHNVGTITSLERLTLADVRDFYRKHYTQANLVVGLAGGYPSSFQPQIMADFARLPLGDAERVKVSAPKLDEGMRIEIIKRDTGATAISLGLPIPVNRAHKDWPALAVVVSYFGQHRSSNSYLYQRIREKRGLNYGDYSYIEYFPRGMFQFQPDPNLGRQSQIFQIWIRPVKPENGHFVLRAALYEYDKLVREGMSKTDFEATREFLSKYVNILTATQDAQLGYALDSRYYQIPDFATYMREQLSRLTLEDVNRAINQYLKSDRMRVVMVTKEAEALRDAIVSNRPSPITYPAPKPPEITEEDKLIQTYKVNVKADDVVVVPVERVFQ